MTALEAFGIVAGVASIIGVILAVRYARQATEKVKRLCYSRTASDFPVVSAKALRDYDIGVVYTPVDGHEERVDSVFVYDLILANLGREPIRRTDIAPANPLRVEVAGARVLDISVEAVTREVINLNVGSLTSQGHRAFSAITFDFLDFEDGALLRILTTSKPDRVELLGDIVGMPSGVTVEKPVTGRRFVQRIGVVASTLLFLSALVTALLVYRNVIGSWTHAWLLMLPLVALILPIVIIIVVTETVWPKPRFTFPKTLLPRYGSVGPWGFEGQELHILMRDGEVMAMRSVSERKKDEGAEPASDSV